MYTTIWVINLGSDTFGNPIFQKVLQNQPSSLIITIATSSQSSKIGLSKWIFYVNLKKALLLKLGLIFDKAAKLGKAFWDAYNQGE